MAQRRPGVDIWNLDEWVDGASQEVRRGTARVYYKSSERNPMLVANEFLASRLATALGLPVPAGDVGRNENGTLGWVTLEIEGTEDYPPPDPAEIVFAAPRSAASCIVFDVWLDNRDRHERNLFYHRDIGFWMIDHDMVLSGAAADLTGLTNKATEPTPLLFFKEHYPPSSHIEQAIDNVRTLPMSLVQGILEELQRRKQITLEQSKELAGYLHIRKKSLAEVVDRSIDAREVSTKEGRELF